MTHRIGPEKHRRTRIDRFDHALVSRGADDGDPIAARETAAPAACGAWNGCAIRQFHREVTPVGGYNESGNESGVRLRARVPLHALGNEFVPNFSFLLPDLTH
jgi:hypothetical protein